MYRIITVIFIVVSLSGCTTFRRALSEARSTITELERSDAERAVRNAELEGLYNSERDGNKELERIISEQQSELNKYIESERERIEEEKRIADSLSGIFGEGSDIIEELIGGYDDIREEVLKPKAME